MHAKCQSVRALRECEEGAERAIQLGVVGGDNVLAVEEAVRVVDVVGHLVELVVRAARVLHVHVRRREREQRRHYYTPHKEVTCEHLPEISF